MTTCGNCGHEFGGEPTHEICPTCGTSHQVFAGPDGAKAVVSVFPVTVVAESNHPDGSTEITAGSWSHKSTTVTSGDGSVSHKFSGRPPRGEEDVLQACESLMEALKSSGVALKGKFRLPDGPEQGVDACADLVAGGVIEVQVVGVGDQNVSKELGTTGQASSTKPPAEMADDVCARVAKKRDSYPSADRETRILVVDAIRSPGYTTEAVAEALKDPTRSEMLRSAGFQAVWLVGPTERLTRRIDV